MPELPEVEAIRHHLASRNIIGATLQDFDTVHNIVQSSPCANQISGSTITSIDRRGKYIVIGLHLPNDSVARLILHMMMTGSLHLRTAGQSTDLRYVRASFQLSDGTRILLDDPRRWAKIWIAGPDDMVPTDNLGPELTDFTATDFADLVRRRRQLIKPALLNQKLVAGIGNIYADEALHAARIAPTRRASDISQAQLHTLHAAIINVFRHATRYIINHPAPDGSPYVVDAHDARMMLPRRGQAACPTCLAPLSRTKVAGRTTIHCQACQE